MADSPFNDVPPENIIVIPADEVSAQWGKFPPGMTTPPWQADWIYITGSKKESDRIEGFRLPALCREELGPEQIPILQNADIVLLNTNDAALVTALASVARQLRTVNVPNLAGCNREQFVRLTAPHWAKRLDPTPEGARSSEDDVNFLPPDIIPPDEQPAPREPEAELPATEVGAHLHPKQEPAPESKPEPERAVPEPQPRQELPPTVGEKPTTRDQQQQGVPIMLTRAIKEALRAHGFSDDEILHISPTQAHEILKKPNGNGVPSEAERT